MALQDSDIAKRVGRARRLARWSLAAAVAALVVAGTGLTLARYDVIAKLAGFSALLGGGLVALLALVLGLGSLFSGRGAAAPSRRTAWIGIAVALLYVGFLGSRPLAAGDAPAIHDVTTDLASPPQFEVLPLRADNLVGVGTLENWRRIKLAGLRRPWPRYDTQTGGSGDSGRRALLNRLAGRSPRSIQLVAISKLRPASPTSASTMTLCCGSCRRRTARAVVSTCARSAGWGLAILA